MSNKNIVSIFSGAGGLDLGFKNKGFNISFANDFNENIKPTYDKNHETELLAEDIREVDIDNIPECYGIIGGPPCQSWSLAGSMDGKDDDRGSVFFDYINIIGEKQPHFFVTENVPGILSKRHIDDFNDIIEEFKNMGYTVKYKKMNAAEYGVPQRRRRVFIVGIRDDLDFDFEFPDPDRSERTQLDTELPDLPDPKPTDGDSHSKDELEVLNHEYYIGSFSSRFMSRNRVRDWNEPAYTVIANARHQKIHPKAPRMVKVDKDDWKFNEQFEDLYRRYSVREAALLQTFPDDFEFIYDDINTGYKMVGNAVPVKMAESIAEELTEI
jgi:DNA (cytosine-5)-methyltransferase 1